MLGRMKARKQMHHKVHGIAVREHALSALVEVVELGAHCPPEVIIPALARLDREGPVPERGHLGQGHRRAVVPIGIFEGGCFERGRRFLRGLHLFVLLRHGRLQDRSSTAWRGTPSRGSVDRRVRLRTLFTSRILE